MTSSVLTGERRWASARRSGMTVLGKVSVPKPINLPSQKLENHGLDPNVEIVPKGMLNWGSRSSSSASNAWGSSTLSPNADGGTDSPSHVCGRPSSGGSGTRPSTGNSEIAHEPIVSAWSSNSRPSSASGALTSSQTSAISLRPQSAETRPGSSQLSRFAESLSENPVAWGTAGTAEKLGVASSQNDGFALTSGDFPTLGSEKDNAGRNTESQDLGSHGQPGSSSGGVAPVKDRTGTSVAGDVSVKAYVKSGTANSWKRDNNPYGEEGARSSVEKWQADPQGTRPYPATGIPHQHFEAWHGPHGPLINNHPGGAWYRGPPRGPPFGSPVPPGGFPVEPFPFYRPQIPATALTNPPPVPPPGARPRVHHPKHGDIYRPPMPDAYMRPGIPIRPGFYPAPVAYEGYYSPPMGYRNSNEGEIPFMGMAAGPPAYNWYSGQNAHDPDNSRGRSHACGPNGKLLASEQVEHARPLDGRGPYRVLLKQQDGWNGKDQAQKQEDTAAANASNVEKGDQPKVSSWENDWRGAYRKDEQGLKRKAFGDEVSYQVPDLEGGLSFVPVNVKSVESRGNANVEDDVSAKKVEQAATTSPEVPACPKDSGLIQKIECLNAKVEDDISSKKVEQAATTSPEFPACPKDSSLIQKIEGLNAKVRASDGRHDLISVSNMEEPKNMSQVVNIDSDEAASGSVYVGKNHTSGINNHTASEWGVSARGKSFKSTAASRTVISRRPTHGMNSRGDHDGKGRFSTQEADGWQKKYPVADTPSVMSAVHFERSNIHVPDYPAKEVSGKPALYLQGKDGGDSVQHMFESCDSHALRAKTRELAKERVKQRQKEEEERARDQKAKAFAKLEELNKRTQAAESLTEKLEVLPGVAIRNKQEDYQSMAESIEAASTPGTSSSALVSNSNDVAQISERATSTADAPNVNDASASKQKRLSHKQKLNIPLERNSGKFITASTTEALTVHADLTVSAASSREVVASEIAPRFESRSPVNSDVMAESSVQQRRRNNRNDEKYKSQDATSGVTLQSVVSTEANLVNSTSGVGGKTKASESKLDCGTVQTLTDSKEANQSLKQRLSSPSEENHFRENNQWKSQHSRRIPRNVQINKTAEKFHTGETVIWAPVQTRTKAEVTGEASQKSVAEPASVKIDNQVQNSSRNRRAEMERYVPKPVAKEMAQQGSSQQQLVAPSVDKTMSDEVDGKEDLGSQAVESSQPTGFANGRKGAALESKTGDRDSRQNKQGKVHGSWRQRVSSETTIVQGLQGSECSHASRNAQKSIEHQQTQKPDVSPVKEQPKYSDEWSSDGWNMPENSESSVPLVASVVKDQGLTARGKRHQFKGQKGAGNSYNHECKNISGDTDKIYVQPSIPVLETNQTDFPVSAKENRAIGDQSTSHWQPKPQSFLTATQRASRPNSGQSVGAEIGRSNKKDTTPQCALPIPHQPDKKTVGGMSQPHRGHSTPQTSKMEESSNVDSQEPKKERKTVYVKGRPNSSKQGPGSLVDTSPPSNVDIRLEQHVSSGVCRNGNRNSRFSRGHEPRGDWSSLSAQESKQHNQRINLERQKHNSHYEYQPVGPNNNHRSNYFEESKDARNNAGGKDRERGQNHSRRGGGNYLGRPSGTIRADGDCD